MHFVRRTGAIPAVMLTLLSACGSPEIEARFPPHVAKTTIAPPVVVRDSDHDGIADPYDACPTLPGVASTILVTSGCPPPGYYDDGLSSRDRDGDSVLDAVDA